MAEKDQIVIDVQINTEEVATKLAEATKALAEHKQQQKELKKAMEESNGTNAVAAKMYAEVTAQIEKESREVKSSSALLQVEAANRLSDNATLDEQRQLLNAAQKAYASMSAEQKAAGGTGDKLAAQIKKLSDVVKKNEAAIGDNRRNVGNYAESIEMAAKNGGLFGSAMQRVIAPIKGATLGLKTMSATPAIAILGLLAQIITSLADKFKSSGAAMEKLTGVFGVFSGVGNIVSKIIDKIASGIGWVAEKAYELADKLGLISDEMEAGKKIAEEDLAIQKEQRRVAKENADDQYQIAKLRAQAAEKDKYNSKQRLALLQQASDLEEGIAKRNYDLAKREYDLQVKKNAQSESSQEDLKKENDLYVNMVGALTTFEQKQKELNTQMAKMRKEVRAADAEEAAAVQHLNAITETFIKDSMAGITDFAKQAEEARKALGGLNEEEEDGDIPTPEEAAARIFGLDEEGVEMFRNLLDNGLGIQEAATQAQADMAKRAADAEIAERQRVVASVQEWANNVMQLANTINEAISNSENAQLQEYEENNEKKKKALEKRLKAGEISQAQYDAQVEAMDTELARKQDEIAIKQAKREKAMAISQTAINTAMAIMSIWAQVPKFDFSATALAQTIMVAALGAAQVAAIASQPLPSAGSYEQGGIVGGTSYSGDRLTANVNSREMILPLDAQTRLFDALTGSDNSELGFNYELMAAAVAAQPAPVVVYKELQDFGDKVSTYKEIARV